MRIITIPNNENVTPNLTGTLKEQKELDSFIEFDMGEKCWIKNDCFKELSEEDEEIKIDEKFIEGLQNKLKRLVEIYENGNLKQKIAVEIYRDAIFKILTLLWDIRSGNKKELTDDDYDYYKNEIHNASSFLNYMYEHGDYNVDDFYLFEILYAVLDSLLYYYDF